MTLSAQFVNRCRPLSVTSSSSRPAARRGGLAALTLLAAAAAAQVAPPPAPEPGGEIVTLPPFQLDAIEPPWARDTRTAIASDVRPAAEDVTSVVGALQGLPGVRIGQPGGPGGRSSVFIRGGEENYAVVLLDGVPLNNSTDSRGGGFDFGTLDSGEFTLAEVLRGPVSARYGPDALAGVIKLTSDVFGMPDGSRIVVEAGRHDLTAARLAAAAHQGALGAAVSAGWLEDGSRARGNYARHASAAAALTWQGRQIELRASVRYARTASAAFPDDSGGPRLAVLRSLEERSGGTTSAEFELLSPGDRDAGVRWRVRAWGAWLNAGDNSPGVAPGLRDPAGLPASLEATALRRGGLAAEAAVDTGADGTLAVGVDGETAHGLSDATLRYGPVAFPGSFASTRDRVGTFAEFTWHPVSGWLVQPSVRLDKDRDFGPRLTPRLGIRAPLAPATFVRLNAGTAYKLPSFYAVSNPLVGNPALKPERAQSADLGLEHRIAEGRGALEIGVFASRYRDGIDFDPGPPPRLVNRSEIRAEGLEAALRLKVAETLELALAGTYADARSEPGGGALRGRARAEGSLRAEWRPSARLKLSAVLAAVGRDFDSSVPTGDVFLPSWRRVDIAGRCQIARGISLNAAVDNLLDARYEEAVGVPSPGIRVRGGIETRF